MKKQSVDGGDCQVELKVQDEKNIKQAEDEKEIDEDGPSEIISIGLDKQKFSA